MCGGDGAGAMAANFRRSYFRVKKQTPPHRNIGFFGIYARILNYTHARTLNRIAMGHARKSNQTSFTKGHSVQPSRDERTQKYTRFVEAFKCVIEEDHPVGMAIIFSDEDVLKMVNERLAEGDRVSVGTWQNYKGGRIGDVGVLAEFERLYGIAFREQMKNLFRKMVDSGEQRSWQRYAWLIERKDDRWNLRSKSVDETPDLKRLVFRKK